ncbi:MAG: DUF364 domain-containing protein [Anaerolineales bacterium]|nr:DUF364 domain-containing protein [Anaerolineales bacterium]
MNNILHRISESLPDGEVEKICVGANWSAVVIRTDTQRVCGLASNPIKNLDVNQSFKDNLKTLENKSAKELFPLVLNPHELFAGVGLAAMNAIIPQSPFPWVDGNAGRLIGEKGAGKRVALVGHFPFVPDLKERVGRLDILELKPREGDFHARQAPEILPQADVIAITSMAFVNGTMEGLLELCPSEAYIIILGPSTPLSPIMFSAGANLLCGSIVEKIDPVCQSVLSGDNFRQVKKNGVRLVAIENPATMKNL